ncbi:Putative Secreted protein [[Torrubiella] hemipterigena]|uniref:Putative Secreted protein n=1 Tax=[Torrubiella] hemipterigena TaxID=1531966 RepID=A0A0A1T466_9HYPO|nr:Putative Secreted protein [[Torrubiella] hemipterigena]
MHSPLVLLSSLLGLAAAAAMPSARSDGPSAVKIRGVSLLGSGCPPGSADIQVDATGTLFEATFSQYEVQTGPGTKAIDWRKNCKLTLNMEFDRGFQFSLLDTDMIGFAEIPKGAKGQCTNTFSFTGNAADQVNYALSLPGHYSGNFDLQSHPSITSWSACGGSTAILNMNTACNISPTNLPALIAVSGPSNCPL